MYTMKERQELLERGNVSTFTFDELILELRRALKREGLDDSDSDLQVILQEIKRRG